MFDNFSCRHLYICRAIEMFSWMCVFVRMCVCVCVFVCQAVLISVTAVDWGACSDMFLPLPAWWKCCRTRGTAKTHPQVTSHTLMVREHLQPVYTIQTAVNQSRIQQITYTNTHTLASVRQNNPHSAHKARDIQSYWCGKETRDTIREQKKFPELTKQTLILSVSKCNSNKRYLQWQTAVISTIIITCMWHYANELCMKAIFTAVNRL